MKRFSKEESSWMLYDWANSAYSVIIMTAVCPLFLKAAAAENGIGAADST
ncbi:MFS transporter, partial [Lysinibacillus sp. D4A1_S13]